MKRKVNRRNRNLIQRKKDKFILNLSNQVYPKKLIKKAAEEFKESVKIINNKKIEIKTDDIIDVLEWLNFLIYEKRNL